MLRKTGFEIESLERREVFSVAPGLEAFAAAAGSDAVLVESTQTTLSTAHASTARPGEPSHTNVTDKEIIDALNNGTQLTAGTILRLEASSVDTLFERGAPERFGGEPMSLGVYYGGIAEWVDMGCPND